MPADPVAFSPTLQRSKNTDPIHRFIEDTDNLVDMLHRAQQFVAAQPGMVKEVGHAVAVELRKLAGLPATSLEIEVDGPTYDPERPLMQLAPRMVCYDAHGNMMGSIVELDLGTGAAVQIVKQDGSTVTRDGEPVTERVAVDHVRIKMRG